MKLENKLFKPGDIVYLKYNPEKRASESYPCIGSPYEIDCKIIDIIEQAGSRPIVRTVYRAITGHGMWLTVSGIYLVEPKNKILYSVGTIYECIVDTELCPRGALFQVNGDYACNDSYGIYISLTRMNTLLDKNYFQLAHNNA